MNIFIHHRDLRFKDNTTLIQQSKQEGAITPIFVFDPKQINPKLNKYFSHNLVQFMIQSLEDLNLRYKSKKGELYFFKGDYIKILNHIHKDFGIQSIGFNIDYSPFAKKRDKKIMDFCTKHKIKLYQKEDSLLHPITEGKTKNPNSNQPYKVFTPFKKNAMKQNVLTPNSSYRFKFKVYPKLKEHKYSFRKLDTLYKANPNVLVKGGRKWASQRIKELKKFNRYDTQRNYLWYETTMLSASINFNVISIRELYHSFKKKFGIQSGLINELYWRDFYYNILYFFPHITKGSFRKKYDNIRWKNSKKDFKIWCQGMTGYPIVDACMRQLNTTGYMHNRGRMIVSNFLIKNLWIDWRWGERYFATQLVDYNISANNGGWQWSSGGGTDAQPYFRIFNAWTQAKKFDKDCTFIKTWVKELKEIPSKDILNWNTAYMKYKNKISYPKPMVDHNQSRKEALQLFKRYL